MLTDQRRTEEPTQGGHLLPNSAFEQDSSTFQCRRHTSGFTHSSK